MSEGLRAAYDHEYARVQDQILRLGSLVEEAIRRALECLQKRDRSLAQAVIDDDQAVNELRFEIEEECLALIATQQPIASDLRAVVAAMNIIVEIERMGDYATGIAKTVILMGDEPLLKPLIDIPKMTRLARDMLRTCLKAFIDGDVESARGVAAQDDEMDRLYRAVFDELVEIMAHKPASVSRATYLLWCAHNLERIGDRVTNIAERVVFMSTGDMKELNL
ncbi:MAG TPA: phosphate signaling complex protein PhoU [Anaerolineae bacterium]|nr:phosphate signaling complex protein PhoU [Anaerolineae bacterium]